MSLCSVIREEHLLPCLEGVGTPSAGSPPRPRVAMSPFSGFAHFSLRKLWKGGLATWFSTYGHFGYPRNSHHWNYLSLTPTSLSSFSVLTHFYLQWGHLCVPAEGQQLVVCHTQSDVSRWWQWRKEAGVKLEEGLGGWEWVPIKGLQARERSPQTMQVPLRAITGLRYCSPFCNAKPPCGLRLPQITASESQSALSSTISLLSSHLENRLLLRSCHDFSWLLLACVKIILSKHYQKNTYCSE